MLKWLLCQHIWLSVSHLAYAGLNSVPYFYLWFVFLCFALHYNRVFKAITINTFIISTQTHFTLYGFTQRPDCVCVFVRVCVCVCGCAYAYVYICVWMCMSVFVSVHKCVCVCVHLCVCVSICEHVCTCIL